ncbi:efflux RND transporter periplasmic adaptor subunit [Chitinophagaceae bacterium MMS25-I14]
MYFFSNKIFPVIVGAAILTVAACKDGKDDASKKKGTGAPKNLRAEGFIVTPQTYSNSYASSGSLLANEVIDIHPEIAGRVTGIFFKEGTFVHKGQLLVQLYDADIKASIQKLYAQKALQVNTLKRQKELLDIGGISRQDYETTQSLLQSADADIAYQQALLQKTKIVAPFDGRIGIRNISPGAVIATTTIIASLQQVNPLKMDFTVPDEYRNSVKNGDKVFFNVDGTLDTLSGKVTALDAGADPNTRTIKIRAEVPNSDNKLVPGSFAHVSIPFSTQQNAMLIPSQSVIPTTRDKKVALVKHGKIQMKTIIIGDRTTDKVQILQGLAMGDTVLTTGLLQVKEGMDVKVTKIRG